MSNVIDFLERMGRDSQLRHATGLDLEDALRRAGIEPGVRDAILEGDQLRLESLLGASHPICCLVNAPEEEEGEEEDDEEYEEDDDEVEDDDTEAEDE